MQQNLLASPRICDGRTSRSHQTFCKQLTKSSLRCWAPQHEEHVCDVSLRQSCVATQVSIGMVASDVPVQANACSAPKSVADLPRHIAIIMDGNRRWAKKQGFLSGLKGHEAGLDALKAITKACQERGVSELTVFAFSAENWNRSKTEVDGLMALLQTTFVSNVGDLCEQGIRFKFFGDLDRLPESAQNAVNSVQQKTEKNTGLLCSVALSYGGRQDILQASQHAARLVAAGNITPDDITEELFESLLLTQRSDISSGPPDLLIRTSGEMRISNFMLWDLAYTEMYFSEKMWPEFTPSDLDDALCAYATRQRRFGAGHDLK